MYRRSRFAALLLGSIACVLGGADWPQWRGPAHSGISRETGLLREWPSDGPKLVWQYQDCGNGYSTPAIVGERLFVQGNEGMENEFVLAIDVRNPKQLWKTRLGNVGPNQGQQYPGARSTPTVDGESVYALGSDGDLACLDIATGKARWTKNLRKDFGGKPGMWAYAESPLVDGDLVVCTPGGEEATVVALNKRNGEVVWKSAVPGGDQAGYASIIVVNTDGLKQYVQFVQNGVVGIDAATGRFLWRYDKTAKGSPANIPTPVAQDSFVFSASGRGGGGLVKLKVDGGVVDVSEIYAQAKLPSAIGGFVLVDNYLYGTNTQGLMCVDFATGDVKWQDRSVGPASLCYANGMLYLHSENGEVALVEATPDEYRERGRFTPANGPERAREKAWAYPVIADGKLYIRDKQMLWCYDVKAE